MIEKQGNRIIGLVGKRGSGKTTLILELLRKFQAQGLQVSGIMSPGIFDGEQKVAIEMMDVNSHVGRLMAVLKEENETGLQFGDWSFFVETLDWANQILGAISACDVLILDEIGPLELDFNKGLQEGLAKMVAGKYKMGIISLRPKCTEAIQSIFPEIELYHLNAIDQKAVKEAVLRIANNLTRGAFPDNSNI